MNNSKEVTLEGFQVHMKEMLDKIFLALDGKEGDINDFVVNIEFNGKHVAMPVHADLFSRLERFIELEIEENEM
ncbi:hypothetical protein Bcp1_017 [Bacillus phage Bcp1]|uniref:Uncharacterized protein n=1 Tax=Bacillus phage Bcp1 TaxID=584892 RepID=X2JIL2_9CAUD|nr:hypothetical protein Bcp1_017 [Bacillus phage Bcp1]AHN66494.1 hypothetical protein Bcp1_017 [Bacillus phage Bcp1]AXQ67685.1 hypothetical protein KIOSHI_8 [Bacillus phage Kioshi]AXQ67880.1 hypothetical protein KIOSHI_264 [Bacillus phage Kioshi]